mgnify:CR=1 FL=1
MSQHRVYLHSDDGDNIVVFVPLRANGTYDSNSPGPHLARGVWEGYDFFAEFQVDPDGKTNAFVDTCYLSGGGDEDAETDFLTVPVKVGQLVGVAGYTFVVRDLTQLQSPPRSGFVRQKSEVEALVEPPPNPTKKAGQACA